MRIPGRFWWIWALLACVVAALGIVFPTFYYGSQISQEIAAGTFSAIDALLFAFMIAFLPLAGLAISLYIVTMAAPTLAGLRRRKRALAGDLQAMPLAFPPVPTDDIPDLTQAPLSLQWRARRDIPLIIKALNFAIITLHIIPTALIVGVQAWELAQQRDKVAYIEANLIQVSAVVALTAAIVALCIKLILVHRFQATHSFGVTATLDGLDCVDELGPHSFVPWAEAHLFEVELRSKSTLGHRIWRLYSDKAVAEWAHRILFDRYLPDGISLVEMKQREDALARVILARTGLQPRTIPKRLIAPIPKESAVDAIPHTLLHS